jgi:hypothetical protein
VSSHRALGQLTSLAPDALAGSSPRSDAVEDERRQRGRPALGRARVVVGGTPAELKLGVRDAHEIEVCVAASDGTHGCELASGCEDVPRHEDEKTP